MVAPDHQPGEPFQPVVLAGGAGRRLWPLSHEGRPKPFTAVRDGVSLVQATVRRLAALDRAGEPLVVCSDAHRFLAARLLHGEAPGGGAIVTEPDGRGTAPAVAAAAYEALARTSGGPDPLLLVLPVDHEVREESGFACAVHEGVRAARNGALVAFAVAPRCAGTGYGYLRAEPGTSSGSRAVTGFVEKPDTATAATLAA